MTAAEAVPHPPIEFSAMTAHAIDAQKDALRDEMRTQRRTMHDSHGTVAAEAAASHGAKFLDAFGRDKVIAAYMPILTEIDSRFLIRDLERSGFQIALPVVAQTGGVLGFRRWGTGDPLEGGPHGTQHPPASAPDIRPDIILCPLLAFDARGHRLGYGGGYYDRTLAALPEARAFGLAYSGQMIDRVPYNDADRSIDAVITEAGTFICAAQEKRV